MRPPAERIIPAVLGCWYGDVTVVGDALRKLKNRFRVASHCEVGPCTTDGMSPARTASWDSHGKSGTLPPLVKSASSPMELAQAMSTRRVAAKAAELESLQDRREMLTAHARRRAQLLKHEADVQKEIEHKAQVTKLTSARAILTNGGMPSATTLVSRSAWDNN